MELALPIMALGGLYIISNQKKQNQPKPVEGFKNKLPNTDIPPQNYPVTNTKELTSTVQQFVDPNVATSKYFNQNVYENKEINGYHVGDTIQDIYSLSGNYLKSEEFKHNNMVPFNGGKVRGQIYHNDNAETVLDNMVGSGSQVIKKIEQAPLFKPEENVQWSYGAPNMSDFYQSRVLPAMKNNMVKPFESVHVGPGLNQGYGTQGTGGYNSGMESRDSWLPKTVDELRVVTNPKEEYSLENHQGPAQSGVKNVGILGKVEKYRPDTFFINTQDRWLTTTGAEKGHLINPVEIIKPGSRNETTSSYSGVAGGNNKNAGYVPAHAEPSKRNVLSAVDAGPCVSRGHGDHAENDKRIESFTNYNNARSTGAQPQTFGSGFSSAVGAVIAPIMDFLKPSRREEYSNNMRVYGSGGGSVPGGYVLNPGDVPNTTNKETTIYSYNGNPGCQIPGGGYESADYQPISNQRDTTTCNSEFGPAATAYGDRNYTAAYNQHNNDIKSSTIANRPNQGGMNIFNDNYNATINKQDCNAYDNYFGSASSVTPLPPSTQTYGHLNCPPYQNQSEMNNRINPDILEAFRKNPYTHSLTYAV
jgi:hypothetical protein